MKYLVLMFGSYYKILLITSMLTVLVTQPVIAKKQTTPRFKEHIIETPFKLTHSLISIDLFASAGKEIVTFSVDDDDNRWLIIYSYNIESDAYKEVERQQLPNDLYSFDITEKTDNALQSIYFMSSDKLYRYSEGLASKNFNFIANINSIAMGAETQYLARGDFLIDLNNDTLDDIYISDFHHVHILIAKADGTFKTQSLPIKPQIELSKNSATYTHTILYFGDVNFDQHIDIIKVGEGQLEYFLQKTDETFSPSSVKQPINKLVSAVDWWSKPRADGEQLDQSNLQYKKVEQFKDINNDNMIDMVVLDTKSSGVLDRTNDYQIYLGNNQNGLLSYNNDADSTIKAEGTLTDFRFVDIDNDNKLEVMLSGFDIGVSQIIGALLSGSIDQDVYLFKMDTESHFNPNRYISKEVELSFSISSGTSGNPVVKLADINGDGLQDLLLSQGKKKLRIYRGITGKKLFSRKSEKYKISIPKQGDMFSVDDVNNDGKDDLLIKYGREDSKKLHNTFKIFLAI